MHDTGQPSTPPAQGPRRWTGRFGLTGHPISATYVRRAGQAVADAVAFAAALFAATLLRHDGRLNEIDFPGLLLLVPPTAAVQIVVGSRFGLYTGRWRYGSFEEVSALARTCAVTAALTLLLDT